MNDRQSLVTRRSAGSGVLQVLRDNALGCEFETGSLSTIQLVDVAKIGREFEPSKGAIALHVEDVEAARSELESRGVEFQGETMDSGVCY